MNDQVSNCCGAEILMADAEGFGTCKECKEHCVAEAEAEAEVEVEKETMKAISSVAEGRNIYQRLADINKEVGVIGKDSTNKTQQFKYRGIDAVMAELHSLFAKHEVFIAQEVMESSRQERPSKSGGINIWSIVKYRFSFITTDGSSVSTEMVGEAMDSGDKGNNKCVSVALKYALTNLFTIPTEEQKNTDPDLESHELELSLTPEVIKEIHEAKSQDQLLAVCGKFRKALGDEYKELLMLEYEHVLEDMKSDPIMKATESLRASGASVEDLY